MEGEASTAPAEPTAKTSTTEESMEESEQSVNAPAVDASGSGASVDTAEAKSLKCDE